MWVACEFYTRNISNFIDCLLAHYVFIIGDAGGLSDFMIILQVVCIVRM